MKLPIVVVVAVVVAVAVVVVVADYFFLATPCILGLLF